MQRSRALHAPAWVVVRRALASASRRHRGLPSSGGCRWRWRAPSPSPRRSPPRASRRAPALHRSRSRASTSSRSPTLGAGVRAQLHRLRHARLARRPAHRRRAPRRSSCARPSPGVYEGSYVIDERDAIAPDSRVTATLQRNGVVASTRPSTSRCCWPGGRCPGARRPPAHAANGRRSIDADGRRGASPDAVPRVVALPRRRRCRFPSQSTPSRSRCRRGRRAAARAVAAAPASARGDLRRLRRRRVDPRRRGGAARRRRRRDRRRHRRRGPRQGSSAPRTRAAC